MWRLGSVASVPPECIELSAMAVANQKALVPQHAALVAYVKDMRRALGRVPKTSPEAAAAAEKAAKAAAKVAVKAEPPEAK